MNDRKREILDLLWNEPYKVGHWVGFRDLTELHNEWLRSFLHSDDDQTLLAHRGSFKTTDLSLFLALHPILYPKKNVLFFRKTDTDVIEVITQAERIMESGCVRRIVQDLYGVPLTFTKQTDSEYSTNLWTAARGTPQVMGLGIGTSITGKHGDVVVTDDIVNLKDRVSRAERERTKLQYMELQNIKNRGGRFINTGTPWHKDDAISIMPNVKRYDCYSTGLIARSTLAELRHSMSDSLFAANYELKHIADADAMFKEPRFIDDEELIYGGIAHVDAAYDGSDGTAFTIIKKTSDGFIGFGKRWNKHVDDCLPEIEVYHERFRAGTVLCEDNADKGYLRKEISKMGMPVHGYHESMNKFIKISTYLRKHWRYIQWLDETDPEYINEILDYTENAEHDDSPDSAASLLRYIDKGEVKLKTFKGGI